MKRMLLALCVSSLVLWSASAYATFNSGSSGVLGAFNPTANTEVVLPEPDGVLNYTTVNIPAGVTVTFKKNSKNTPVYMLATGDVIIAGTISVNGGNATATDTGKGGPGGFDGGYGGGIATPGGKGFGPGGGNPGRYLNNVGGGGGGGGFGSNGINGSSGNWGTGGSAYGNLKILPLIGGSGGGGGSGEFSRGSTSGGGGGGAIVIASSTSITLTGSITANGGNGILYNLPGGGGGSGGAVKLAANIISGNGAITANGGSPGEWGGYGGPGRTRLEANTNNRTAVTDPPFSFGSPSSVFVPNSSTLKIESVAGYAVPATPTGNYNQPDIPLPSSTTNPVPVNISATNIPDGTTITVWVIPQYGNATSVDTILSSSTATANVTLSTTYANVVTAQATFTVVGMYYNGEEIDKVRVAATMGGKSETTYITKSGKEIKGELLAALMK